MSASSAAVVHLDDDDEYAIEVKHVSKAFTMHADRRDSLK